MYATVATLQMAAQRMQLSGELDQSKCRRIMSQLRQVADELIDSERRLGKQKANPVNFSAVMHDAAAGQDKRRIVMRLADEIMVEGPGHDLHDLLCSLFEHALTVGCEPIDARVEVKCVDNPVRDVCSTELCIQSPDLPDFLQRKLWDAVRARRGEVSLISEPERCRIGFTLPIERRRAAEV